MVHSTHTGTPDEVDLRQRRDALRRDLRGRRAALSTTQLRASAEALALLLEPEFAGIACIAGYSAIGGEMPVDVALRAARSRGIVTSLPMISDKRLVFVPFDESTRFLPNRFGIPEPDVPADRHFAPQELDLVLVPLVGFDAGCHRLGMGGGFYDRSFAFRADVACLPRLVGVAHAMQRVTSVHPMPWDVPLDAVVTELGVQPRNIV